VAGRVPIGRPQERLLRHSPALAGRAEKKAAAGPPDKRRNLVLIAVGGGGAVLLLLIGVLVWVLSTAGRPQGTTEPNSLQPCH